MRRPWLLIPLSSGDIVGVLDRICELSCHRWDNGAIRVPLISARAFTFFPTNR